VPSPQQDNSTRTNVAIIGGGVIGLCTAYYALKAGKTVTVLDREPSGGDNCSAENAGMVVPSHFVPLAAPGMISLGLRWMLNPESPFAIRLRPSLDLLRWGYLFWKHANKAHVAASRELLRDLNLRSRALFAELADEEDYGLAKRGLVMLCAGQQALDDEAHLAEDATELGLDVEVCDAKRLAEVDPDITMAAAGGVWFKQDCHMNPGKFLARLRTEITRMGGEIRHGVDVKSFTREDGRIVAAGDVEADQFVVAGGAWSPELARGIGLKLPMQAGKGYSMTVPAPVQLPQLCSILTEARVAVTPMGDSLRFAGTMEIGKNDLSVNERRIAGIVKSIPRYFPQFKTEHFEGLKRWAGLRPCSPDGLPYIGPTREKNIFIATGHSMMGLSLAPVTGQLMAQLLCGETPEIEIAQLAPRRFS
jgi:D-amino-acid dehydrogenase